MMRKTRGVGVPRPLGKAAVPMRKLAGFPLAAVLLTLQVRALEPVVEPIATSGYTYYVIDAGGKLYAWGDSFHGAVGPADQDPLYWEDANILLENARYVAAGFVMAAAIDTDGALWGWGGHAGRTFGEEEPYRLLEDVAEVSIGDTSCTALRTDGTVWIWGARSGESLKKHPDDPFFRPVQVLDHVARLEGDMAVLEDGTLVQFGFDGDTLTARTLMKQVADVRTWSGFDSGAFILVQGLDGSLWRVPRVTVSEGDAAYEVFGQPEKFLEKVDWFTPSLAVTADGSLWAWGQFRPAMLREGQVDPSDPLLTASLPATEYDNGVVKIMEGVAAAVNCSDRTLVDWRTGRCGRFLRLTCSPTGRRTGTGPPTGRKKFWTKRLRRVRHRNGRRRPRPPRCCPPPLWRSGRRSRRMRRRSLFRWSPRRNHRRSPPHRRAAPLPHWRP